MSNSILDSGNRTKFSTGAVRDIQEDKGRCDLMPLHVVARLLDKKHSYVLHEIENYKETKNAEYLYNAIQYFCKDEGISLVDMMLEVSLHYRDGAEKYGEDNWKNGLPVKSYISSAVRHLLKHIDGYKDEAHHRGFVWNIMSALWTITNKPELIDAPFNMEEEVEENE